MKRRDLLKRFFVLLSFGLFGKKAKAEVEEKADTFQYENPVKEAVICSYWHGVEKKPLRQKNPCYSFAVFRTNKKGRIILTPVPNDRMEKLLSIEEDVDIEDLVQTYETGHPLTMGVRSEAGNAF